MCGRNGDGIAPIDHFASAYRLEAFRRLIRLPVGRSEQNDLLARRTVDSDGLQNGSIWTSGATGKSAKRNGDQQLPREAYRRRSVPMCKHEFPEKI
jgi:hypothetical protein